MKTAIYVPDELWNTARDLFPSDGDSGLVQRGLRALLREWNGTPELDEIVDAMTEEHRQALLAAILGADDA
jgi:hypothetical protein